MISGVTSLSFQKQKKVIQKDVTKGQEGPQENKIYNILTLARLEDLNISQKYQSKDDWDAYEQNKKNSDAQFVAKDRGRKKAYLGLDNLKAFSSDKIELLQYPKTLSKELPSSALFSQIARGVRFMHHNDIVHMDLKEGNICLNRKGTPKIIDFGVSKDLKEPLENQGPIGTRHYQSPELIHAFVHKKISGVDLKKADIFSLGVLFFNRLISSKKEESEYHLIKCVYQVENKNLDLSLRKKSVYKWVQDIDNTWINVWKDPDKQEAFRKIISRELKAHCDIFGKEAIECIVRMLDPLPEKRPSLDQIIDTISKKMELLDKNISIVQDFLAHPCFKKAINSPTYRSNTAKELLVNLGEIGLSSLTYHSREALILGKGFQRFYLTVFMRKFRELSRLYPRIMHAIRKDYISSLSEKDKDALQMALKTNAKKANKTILYDMCHGAIVYAILQSVKQDMDWLPYALCIASQPIIDYLRLEKSQVFYEKNRLQLKKNDPELSNMIESKDKYKMMIAESLLSFLINTAGEYIFYQMVDGALVEKNGEKSLQNDAWIHTYVLVASLMLLLLGHFGFDSQKL